MQILSIHRDIWTRDIKTRIQTIIKIFVRIK